MTAWCIISRHVGMGSGHWMGMRRVGPAAQWFPEGARALALQVIDVSSETLLFEEISLPDGGFIFILCYAIIGNPSL